VIFLILEIIGLLRYKVENLTLSTLFLFAGIAFEALKIQTAYTSTYDVMLSAGMLINLLAVIFLNPLEASLVAAISIAASSLKRLKIHTSFYKYFFNISQIGLATLITALMVNFLKSLVNTYVASGIVGPIVYIFLNSIFIAIGVSLEKKEGFFGILNRNFLFLLPSFLFLFPSIVIILILSEYAGLLFVPISLALLLLALLGNYYRKLYEEAKIENMMILVKSLEERDEYTYGHSQRVANISEKIAKKLGFKESHIERIKIAAMLHDIGKIGIADNILRKPGRLSEAEFEEIKKHPVKGYEILKKIRRFQNHEAKWVKYHHERLDGSGYPEGLKGDQIPLESKIIAVADIYEALTSDRPYRKAMTKEQALEEMRKMVGNAIDEKVFKAFLEALEEEGGL